MNVYLSKWFAKRPSLATYIGSLIVVVLLLVVIPPAFAQDTGVMVENTAVLRIRSGPGTQFEHLINLPWPAVRVPALGRNADSTWVFLDYNGVRGWSSATNLRTMQGSISNLPVITDSAGPIPPPGGNTGAPIIQFTVNGGTSANINVGGCATVAWSVENINQVYYQGQGVVGAGSRNECPSSTSIYTLRVLLRDGNWVERQVTISVNALSVSPLPTTTPFGRLDWTLASNFGRGNLVNGFAPDPYAVYVTSGGTVDTSYLQSDCTGYATSAPDFSLNYSAGSWPLRIYFVADFGGDDATLIIRRPDGRWSCSDDTFDTVNPSIRWDTPLSGEYDIWVGSYWSGDYLSGTLYITEVMSNHP